MSVDPELVTRKMVLMTRDLAALEIVRSKGRDAYLVSAIDQAVAERHLERMIGRMIDVNYHVLTESGHPPPSDYHGSFVQLGTLGIVSGEFARRLAACAGLRNRIVHEYDELDHARVFEAVETSLKDVPAYLDGVVRFLDHLPRHAD